MELFQKLIFICPLLFAAGVIDGISGGGGIIALPTYLMAGLPISTAYGCNKMQSSLGTSASLFRYAKSGLVDAKAALVSGAAAIIGSFVSTRIMLVLEDSVKNGIIVALMVFIVLLTLAAGKLTYGDKTRIDCTVKNIFLCFVIGLVLGLYDGFFGPGGGTIALMLFTLVFKYDMRTACGNGKVVIVISNLIALINYIAEGSILYSIAIPATIANILGSYLGASLAVKNGAKLVRVFLIIVVAAVLVQAFLKLK